jgi:E3 ubiquitin-protein ligase BRE1
VGTQAGALTHSVLSDWTKFKAYELERSEKLKSAIEELLAKPTIPIDSAKLQEFLNKTDAAMEEREKQLKQVNVEKEQLAELLENATDRYLKAERKLDRSKSMVVAMIDRQHQNQSQSSPADQATPTVNGEANVASPEATAAAVQEAEGAKLEAIAAAEQRKLHIEKLETENKSLTEEITKLNSRLSSLTDDDYAKTELFKAAKAQHEGLIKRIEHLEATHLQLREEAKKLQADRTTYRLQMEEESSTAIKESESDLARAESNEQRLRAERDNYQSKCSILESSRSEHKVTIQKLQELLDARDSQIQDLEAEVQQLRTNFGDTNIDSEVNLDDLSAEELKAKVAGLQRERALLQQEIRHMETAFKKSQALAVKKVAEFQAFEDRIAQLQAEKAKADQKYFGAMKTQVARTAERDALSVQNKKTSSLIAAFKDTIARLEETQRGHEKQLAEHRDIIEGFTYRTQTSENQASQAEFTAKQSSNHIVELQKSLAAKDATILVAQQLQREAEVEVEKLNVRLAETKKKVDEWRIKARANPTEEVDMLRVSFSIYLYPVLCNIY